MIMYRNGIPLIPAEELGHHLGLTVDPDSEPLFYDVRVSETPPSGAGYGTQIYQPEYDPNKVFPQLGIPLEFTSRLVGESIHSEDDLMRELREIEDQDEDALLCFNHGVIRGAYEPFTGHVVVFDRVLGSGVRVVDASWRQPKWRVIDSALLFDAVRQHGPENSGGVWRFRPTGKI